MQMIQDKTVKVCQASYITSKLSCGLSRVNVTPTIIFASQEITCEYFPGSMLTARPLPASTPRPRAPSGPREPRPGARTWGSAPPRGTGNNTISGHTDNTISGDQEPGGVRRGGEQLLEPGPEGHRSVLLHFDVFSLQKYFLYYLIFFIILLR